MKKTSDGAYIIGFDDGYQMAKTATEVFENGVYPMSDSEPTINENSLYYEGRLYKIGEDRAVITEDKLSDNNARLLTMVAMAKELRKERIFDARVVLGVGLPFSNYGRDKAKLKDYYLSKNHLEYIYEGDKFNITIQDVIVCPQCYAAIAPRLGNMNGDYIVIDIGSKTTDVVFVRNGLPIESKSITIEKALIKWMKAIQSRLFVQKGKEIPETEIFKVFLGHESFLSKDISDSIEEMLSGLTQQLILELSERGYNFYYNRIIFIGGGASVVKKYLGAKNNIYFDVNIKANAIGYEFLAYKLAESN